MTSARFARSAESRPGDENLCLTMVIRIVVRIVIRIVTRIVVRRVVRIVVIIVIRIVTRIITRMVIMYSSSNSKSIKKSNTCSIDNSNIHLFRTQLCHHERSAFDRADSLLSCREPVARRFLMRRPSVLGVVRRCAFYRAYGHMPDLHRATLTERCTPRYPRGR